MILKTLILLIIIFLNCTVSVFSDEKYKPYGVNGWFWNLSRINLMKKAHIYYYRIMVPWRTLEPEDNVYTWTGAEGSDRASDFQFHIVNLRAANRNATKKVKISLCIYDSPLWARKDPKRTISYDPEKYAEFVLEVLKYCDSFEKGLVEAVEVTNEEQTGEWIEDEPPVYGTDQRDPSWYYVETLKKTYETVKKYNPEILVVLDGIWAGAYHHLDELYQLGCKGYFDRINFHYYTGEDIGVNYSVRVKPWTICIEHFPTVLGYLKNIADRYEDNSPIWLTEFGWRIPEEEKAKQMIYVMNTCRKSGFVERINYYEFASRNDQIAMVYTKELGEDNEFNSAPVGYKFTKSYYEYKKFAEKYPVWDKKEKLTFIPPALKDADIKNSNFEDGKTYWEGDFSISPEIFYSGKQSACINSSGTLISDYFKVEQNRLYEVSFRVKVDGEDFKSVICVPSIEHYDRAKVLVKKEAQNFWGIVDTRKYPQGWRRFICPLVPPPGATFCRLKFEVNGEGVVYIDEIKLEKLDLEYLNKQF